MTKRCVVIGGSGALGRTICAQLAAEGARVAFTYNTNKAVADEIQAKSPGFIAKQVDVIDSTALAAAIDAMATELGGVDALIHAAAIGVTGAAGAYEKISEIDIEGWERLMAVNVRSAFFAVKQLRSALVASHGNVVFVGSIDGVKSVPAPVHYGASKGALHGMVLTLSKELGEHGVKVNMVAPGVMDAGLSKSIPADLKAEYIKHCGLRRLAAPSEIANVVTWLATENTYVTGKTWVVDGGL